MAEFSVDVEFVWCPCVSHCAVDLRGVAQNLFVKFQVFWHGGNRTVEEMQRLFGETAAVAVFLDRLQYHFIGANLMQQNRVTMMKALEKGFDRMFDIIILSIYCE